MNSTTTDWYPTTIHPLREGWYEATYSTNAYKICMRYWHINEKRWLIETAVGQQLMLTPCTFFGTDERGMAKWTTGYWRGLTEESYIESVTKRITTESESATKLSELPSEGGVLLPD